MTLCSLDWRKEPTGMSEVTLTTDVFELTASETARLLQSTLEKLDLTADELRRQAQEGAFESEQARRAWFALEGLL